MEWFNNISKLINALFVGTHVGPGGVPYGTKAQILSITASSLKYFDTTKHIITHT